MQQIPLPSPLDKERPFLPRINDGDILVRFGKSDQYAVRNNSLALFNKQVTISKLIISDLLFQVPQRSWTYLLLKRGIDISVALLGLFILALLLTLIIPCILWEDRGPIFYRQLRVGRHGKLFRIYKIRSMIVNADNYLLSDPMLLSIWQQQGKLLHDPRVTRVGQLLRRTGLDELPQMLNVLRGEMSLVGPRAVQMSELVAFGDLNELRLRVKPGLTGLWQISDRSTTTYLQRGLLDCTYMMERSLLTDFYILCKTFPAIVYGSGAS
jgi:lipopolysaccharide/colanic/teichoic acid biosynthesis glycosyltransferase